MTDTPTAGHNRLSGIDPEKLLVIDLEEIAPLLEAQYKPLAERTAELTARADAWLAAHKRNMSLTIIADDADLAATADLYAQIKDHAAMGGEIDETRKKVKNAPIRAVQAIDAHFKGRATPLNAWLDMVSAAQLRYLREAKAREAREAAARAEALRIEAELAIQEARAQQTPEAIETAVTLEDRFEEAAAEASQPHARIQIRSALGTLTTADTKLTYEIVDMVALCRAIGEGKVPSYFVIPNDSVIKQALRGKSPMRQCPGLTIFEDVKITRRNA